jgi:hypothetical protein
MKDEKLLLFGLFLTSALADTLDDISNQNYFVKDFKKKTNQYREFLKNKTFKLLNDSYEIDSEFFELIDTSVTNAAIESANETFKYLFELDNIKKK